MSFETKVNYTSTLELLDEGTIGKRQKWSSRFNCSTSSFFIRQVYIALFELFEPSFNLFLRRKVRRDRENDRSSFFFQMIEHNTDTIFDTHSRKKATIMQQPIFKYILFTSYLCQNPLTRSEPEPIWHTPPVTCRIRCPPLRTSRPP